MGRLNKLNEFLKQEDKLKSKYECMKEQIKVMDEKHRLKMIKIEELQIYSTTS